MKKKLTTETRRRGEQPKVEFPGSTVLTLDVTIRRGKHSIHRKVSVPYPKKLYPFELKSEIDSIIFGFKSMNEVMHKTYLERQKHFCSPLRLRAKGQKPKAGVA